LIDWGGEGLNNKGISLADIVQNTNKDILITKFEDLALTQWYTQIFSNRLG
ncbi:unnamed protein product, partial [marine sediment metagenome]